MAQPDLSPYAAELYGRLAPFAFADEENGWALAHFCGALASAFDEIDEIVRDSDDGPGWSMVFDPDRAPEHWLPWLGQFTGARIPPGLSVDDQRAYLKDAPGHRRGTPAAMKAAAAPFLTGNRSVTLLERDGGAWKLTAITYDAETLDAAAAEAAIRAQKPAGIVLTYRVDPGWTVGEFEDFFDGQTVADVEAAFASVSDLESNLPI